MNDFCANTQERIWRLRAARNQRIKLPPGPGSQSVKPKAAKRYYEPPISISNEVLLNSNFKGDWEFNVCLSLYFISMLNRGGKHVRDGLVEWLKLPSKRLVLTSDYWVKRSSNNCWRCGFCNWVNLDIIDCMDHEEIVQQMMRISLSLENEHKLRMMMGDDTLARMINKKGVNSIESNGQISI